MLKLLKNLFHTTKSNVEIPKNSAALFPHQNADGWIYPYPATTLLNTELRQKYLGLIWQQVSMTKEMFNSIYQQPIERYAEMVQLLPASENHHHAHLGGMLDHGLEVITFAAKLRQNYVLPQNAAPEEQSKQRDAWTAAAIYAALVHDIGKIVVDIEIQLQNGQQWFAWNGLPSQPYKFKYIKGRDYELHPVLGSFLGNYLIPKEAFDWLAQYPAVFSTLMYVMSGHYDKGGLLSEIVQKADQYSTTLALGGDINKVVQRPIQSLSKQLLLALRHLLQQKLKINTPQGPADGWFTQDGLWLMSKTTADQIRAYLMEQGISVPHDNRKLFDEMQSYGIVESTMENTAIWHCRIKADSGWSPPNTFSLLRIKPEIAWDNIDDHPKYFAGNIIIVNNDDKEISNEKPVKKTSINFSGEEKIQIQSQENIENNSQENISIPITNNSTDSTNNIEEDSTKYLLNLFEKSPQELINTVDDAIVMETTILEKQPQPIIKKTDSDKSCKISAEIHESTGDRFINWLKKGIFEDRFPINKTTAKIHLVKDEVGHINLFLVSPSIFELYFQQSGEVYEQKDVIALQYAFQALGLHKKRIISDKNKQDSVNFWCCSVIGPRKSSRLTGYLIPNTELFLGSKVLLPNQRLTLIEG
ncbi:MobH family relaxase [Caviibacterium pharyngocola]|uniref:Relaxase n=1 Tax=Caviibacterium pharyngocola TaxID=28159 RepID=A0A2M8RUM7_9PAST|nr:MobH family relaxase [Caviibacterium pharyngocola]PJG82590.1 relaxase [Caviibacterium pharyngocola]